MTTTRERGSVRTVRGATGRRWKGALAGIVAIAMLATIAPVTARISGTGRAEAAPASATDESKIPHYFGPYPNWANSPQVTPNAVVTIDAPPPGGTQAEASATVDPKTGAITGITVTVPGSGYATPPAVTVTAPGAHMEPFAAAAAVAEVATGAITSIAVDAGGFGYTAPAVSIVGDGTTPAAAQASGGVDALTLVDGGSGYVNQPIIEFSLPDLPDGTQATGTAVMDATGAVSSVEIVDAGSGYLTAPTVRVLDGNADNPTGAVVTATINVSAISIVDAGAGYTVAPEVVITDSTGTGIDATATATVATLGAIVGVTVTDPGSGYLTPGLKKFVDTLPGLGEGAANNLGNYIPVAVPDTTTYPGTDYYEIAVVQYRHQFHSSLPPTLLRGYVQLSTKVVPGKHVRLENANLDPNVASAPISLPNGQAVYGVDTPHYLGPTIVASKDRPVRILFRNLLPTGSEGDLFLPVDTTLMGAGPGPGLPNGTSPVGSMMIDENGIPMEMAPDEGSVLDGVRNPVCGNSPKPGGCYTENRAELHLHGGVTPWISDGTPHQWVTPGLESTIYPKGVSVSNVPDMADPGPGAMTFFYTNQQSARLMFYHDHAWGITRLNVYAGEAAAYLITDDTEQRLFGAGGPFADLGIGTPLVVQDKTFVPSDDQIAQQDPTWDKARWGGIGSLWIPHVYMPAQNPGDPGGMSSFGRWMYGPWFWPPAVNTKHGPIANPYYHSEPGDGPMGVDCDPNVAEFCEPQLIPGTANISVGMEAFNDTPVVNGTAYPTTSVDPKTYRFRVLNAANDRFFNLSWYVADPTTGTLSEVALNPAEVAAAQTDPVVFPTPDTSKSPAGPNWIQIGTEGGFLPTPVVVPAQPTTWITDPTRFDVGNVDQHSLLLAPAERADVIVDFSQFRGKTLILYNDAPAAFPARVPGYDYYTGGPDLSPSGAPTTLPGYGPNTRTVMQVKVSAATAAPAFDRPGTSADRLGTLMAAFAHQADGSGVFESGQHTPIVGQAAYNTALGTNFAASGWCNAPTNPSAKCDGYARIQEQGHDQFKFDTVDPNAMATTTVAAASDAVDVTTFDGQGTLSVATTTVGFGKNGNLTVITDPGVTTANLSYTGLSIVKNNAGAVTSVTFTGVKYLSGSGVLATGMTVNGPQGQLAVPFEPKGIHDEMNSATFDEFGRMTANLGLEAPGATPLTQNIILYPYTNPATEVLGTDNPLPTTVDVTPISSAADGTQIWKITHNGVDTHPIHFHLFDVQVINRVTWDNIIIPPDATELGWKDTVRISPLEDTIVAVRPIIPTLPFAIPDSRRPLNPMMPIGAKGTQNGPNGNEAGFNNTDANGNPIAPIVNQVANFFWEYVFHCHILSHEEMDMMRPVNVKVNWDPPVAPVLSQGVGNGVVLSWTDGTPVTTIAGPGGRIDIDLPALNMKQSEIGFKVERALLPAEGQQPAFVQIGTALANATRYNDTTAEAGVDYVYRVSAWNEQDTVESNVIEVLAGSSNPTSTSATNLTSSGDPSAFGAAVTFTATVTTPAAGVTPTGTVEFSVGGVTAATVDLDATGVATFTTSLLPAGTSTVTASYGGTAPDAPVILSGSSDTVVQHVNKAASSTDLVSSDPVAVIGDAITFTATVTPSTATGTVTFTFDAGLSTATTRTANVIGGVAQFTTPLIGGAHTVKATYNGDANLLPSTSPTIDQTVTVRPTSTTLTTSRNPALVTQSITFTAQVVDVGTSTAVDAGVVTFTFTGAGSPSPQTVALDTNGRATFTTTNLPAGSYSVVASYNATNPWGASASSAVAQVVNKRTSSVNLQSSVNPSVFGQAVTFTATMNTVVAAGTVTFTIDGTRNILATLDNNGQARAVVSNLTVGSHSVRATYNGSPLYATSTSTVRTQTVNKANTNITLASSANPQHRTWRVTFTAKVASSGSGVGVPKGYVRFTIDGVTVADVLLNQSGTAAYATSALSLGNHTVSATYLGSPSHNASSRRSLTQRIIL